jgi:hypothetical protein
MLTAKQLAIHEAGHAVIAYRLGLEVGKITIEPSGDILGASLSAAEWADGSTDREQIITLFAGYAAESKSNPGADAAGSQQDDDRAARLLELQPPGSDCELRDAAAALVDENWPQISTVANALCERLTLADGWEIIVDAIDEGDDWRSVYKAFLERRNPLAA